MVVANLRFSRPLRFCCTLLCSSLLLTLCRSARADAADNYDLYESTGPVCPLPFSPFAHDMAAPGDLACGFDQDGDGLSDVAEAAIARCFVPALKFDPAENARRYGAACGPDYFGPCIPGGAEPVALFNVYPQTTGFDAFIDWVLVYDRDGGFYDVKVDSNAHPGDTESINMRIAFSQDAAGRWQAELTMVSVNNTWDVNIQGVDALTLQAHFKPYIYGFADALLESYHVAGKTRFVRVIGGGTNPIIYPSAGKHHDSLLPYDDHLYGKARVRSPFLFFDTVWVTLYEQHDRALGTEPVFVPPVRSFRFANPGSIGDISLREGWHNVGRLEPQNGPIGSTSVALSADCEEKEFLSQVHEEACTPKCFPGCDPADDPCCQANPLCDCSCPVPQPPHCEPVPEKCAELEARLEELQDAPCSYPSGNFATVNQLQCANPDDPTEAKFVSDRDFQELWGYGESLGADLNFCGTAPAGCETDSHTRASAPLEIMQYKGPKDGGDADSDSLVNKLDICPFVATSPGCVNCSVTAGCTVDPVCDGDQDGAGDACDPNPAWFDRWVAEGHPATTRAAYQDGKVFAIDWHLTGWLDSDQDGLVNGADRCPNGVGGASSNLNAWGENADFENYGWTEQLAAYSESGADGAYRPTRAHLGFVTRGDGCDPYEVTLVTHSTSGVQSGSVCNPLATWGTGQIAPIQVVPSRGVSSNDSSGGGKPQAVQVDLRRCGCSSSDDTECFNPFTGECPQIFPLRTAQQVLPGSNWLPVQRPGCKEQTQGELRGFCVEYPATSPMPLGSGPGIPLDWEWFQELADDANRPFSEKHFRPGWFSSFPGGLQGPYLGATVRFVTATETRLDNPATGDPVVHARFARLVGHEADISPKLDPASDPAAPADLSDWQLRTRRLRTFFSSTWFEPSELHLGPNPGYHFCLPLTVDPYWKRPTWPPEWPYPGKPDLPPIDWQGVITGWALLVAPSEPALSTVVDLRSGRAREIRVFDAMGVEGTLADLISTGSPILASVASEPLSFDAVPLADRERGRSGLPRIVVVARAPTGGGRWWLLDTRAEITGDSPIQYHIASTGSAPAAAIGLRLHADGATVVAYEEGLADSGGRRAHVLHVDSGQWSSPALAQDALRAESGVAVHGGYVFRAGGRDSAGTGRGDALAIDYRTGLVTNLPAVSETAFPPRISPILAWDDISDGLVLAGGKDVNGAPRGDVWSLRPGMVQAEQIVADPGTGVGLPSSPGSLVVADARSRIVALWGTSATSGEISRWAARGNRWEESGISSTGPSVDACPDGQPADLCPSVSPSAWWDEPARSCGGLCTPIHRTVSAGPSMLPQTGARDIAISAGMLYLGSHSNVEIWDVSGVGNPWLKATIPAGAQVEAVAVDQYGVGVATVQGFVRISQNDWGFVTSGKPVRVCGRPLDVLPLDGGSRWLVTTTAGAALFDKQGEHGIRFAGGTMLDTDRLSAPMPGLDSPAGDMICEQWVGSHSCGMGAATRPGKGVARVGSEILHVRGRRLLRLRIAGDDIRVVEAIALPGPASAVRAHGDFAYVTGTKKSGQDDVMIRLGPAMEMSGRHDLRSWVLRTDGGVVGARMAASTGPSQVEVVWFSK